MATAAACLAVMIFAGCGESGDDPAVEIPVEAVSINQPSASAIEALHAGGGTVTLSVSIEPANATNKAVDWSSSNDAIATVNNSGVVTGTGEGNVTITATTKSGSKKAEFPLEVKPDPSKVQMIELKSPIRENTTLKDLGLPVDYFYAGNNKLSVENSATLTIEPGVTIRFTATGGNGGILIQANSAIIANGTAAKRIQFIGANDQSVSWDGILIESNLRHEFAYCDFLNAGLRNRHDAAALFLNRGAKADITHCTFVNGNAHGLLVSNYGGNSQLTAFNNNMFEGFELAPVRFSGYLKHLEKFDMTSDMTKNKYPYIEIASPDDVTENTTINQTTVPYYFMDNIGYLQQTLTINAGVTIYLAETEFVNSYGIQQGRLMINGTADNKVLFTRLPGTTYYWYDVTFHGLKGSVVNHCIFEYGGRSQTDNGMIRLTRESDVTLNNVEARNAQTYGINLSSSGFRLVHSNVTFSGNTLGNVWDRTVRPNVVRPQLP
jgi:hypothetical protein